MNDADGNFVPSQLERKTLYGAPWKGGEFDRDRIRWYGWLGRPGTVEEARMDRRRSVMEDLLLYTTGKPFEAYPDGMKPWELGAKARTAEGAVDLLPSVTAGQLGVDDPNMSPKERAIALNRLNLFNMKKRLYPVIEIYLQEMEEHPELEHRNTMAGVVMTHMVYATKMTDSLKCVKMLQEIFGHTQTTVVVEDKTTLEQRKARLLAAVNSSLKENGLLGGLIDAESVEVDGGGHSGDAGAPEEAVGEAAGVGGDQALGGVSVEGG